MRRTTKKRLSIILSMMLVLSLFGTVSPAKPAKEARAAGYGLSNPRVTGDDETTWDCVYFGNYWQNDTNGDGKADKSDAKQPIKWRVLSVDGDDAFLLADKNLDCQPYNEEYTDVTWETCTLRQWLNSDFYENAFDSSEQSAVRTTNVVNEDNPEYGTEGGNNTSDKVFLLSIGEVRNTAYGFPVYDTRGAKNTDYAKECGAWTASSDNYAGNGDWWLRSSGCYSDYASCVYGTGSVCADGFDVSIDSSGVRPALHLNLSSSKWRKAGTVSSSGDENAEVTATPDYLDEEQDFIKKHVEYIGNNRNNKYRYLLDYCDLSKIALRDYSELKDSYDKWRLLRGSIFDNPYEVALAELIISEKSVEGQEDSFSINLYSQQRTIINDVMKLINGKVSLTSEQKSKMEKLFSEKNFADDTTYQLCADILSGYVSESELKTLFQTYDTSNTFMGLLGDGKKIVDSVVDVINYASVLQAYNETSDEFKDVLLLVENYCQGENAELDFVITKYLSSDNAFDIKEKIAKKVVGNTIDVGKDLFQETIVSKVRNFLIENMDLSHAAQATELLAVVEGMKIGYSLGTEIDNVLFNTDTVTDAYITAYASCKLSYYMKFALEDFAANLQKNQTRTNAELFCEAFNMYKHTQIDVAKNMIRYFSSNEQSLIDKIFKNSDYEVAIYQWQILKLNWDNAKCHDESTTYGNTKNITIACPVDIEVTDASKNLILKVENNAVTRNNGTAIATIRNHIKYITLPDNSYSVDIKATANGEMSYNITNYHSLEPAETVNYENIELIKGKTYIGTMTGGEELSIHKNALFTDGTAAESISSLFVKEDKINVKEIKLDRENLELVVGETEKIEAEISPANASVKTVTWYSEKPDVASVDEYGGITALGEGSTTIYCSALSGKVTSKCEVTVNTAESSDILSNPRMTSDGVTTWDCVYFGNYWQNDTNGDGKADKSDAKQPIKWRVLSVDGDDAFLLADKSLDCQRYNKEYMNVTWETCTLRQWLNSDFYENAFDSSEQNAVLMTTVVNEDNPKYGTEGGNNTSDKVFLLSIGEASNTAYGFHSTYNYSTKTRTAKNTEYTKECGAYTGKSYDYAGNGCWWLRSSGDNSYSASYVLYSGSFHVSYAHGSSDLVVRPALHLNLSSSKWSKAGTVNSLGDVSGEVTPPPTSTPTLTATPTSTATPPPTSTPTPTILSTITPTVTPTVTPDIKEDETPSVKPSALPTGEGTPSGTGIQPVTSSPAADDGNEGTVSLENGSKGAVTPPAKVKLKKAVNKKGRKLSLSWNKVKEAKGYRLQYAGNKKFKKKKSRLTKKTKYTIKKLKKKKTYYIRVRAYKVNSSKKVYGRWSKVKKIKVKR